MVVTASLFLGSCLVGALLLCASDSSLWAAESAPGGSSAVQVVSRPQLAVASETSSPDGAKETPLDPRLIELLNGKTAGGGYFYNSSGRRDPFAVILKDLKAPTEAKSTLPPLQRVAVTELSVIAIVWGGFGYSAMVQTPEGKGYVVKPGVILGSNNGVVSAITEKSLIVQERFTDVYGKRQIREHVKLLHPKEISE
jgi:type IV pilus assembly protein PilP